MAFRLYRFWVWCAVSLFWLLLMFDRDLSERLFKSLINNG